MPTETTTDLSLPAREPSTRAKVTRERATVLLAECVARARLVNRTPIYAFRVDTLVLFGSYLSSDRPKIGDIDLAIRLVRRSKVRATQEALEKASRHARHRVRAQPFRNTVEFITWPSMEVYLEVKGRSGRISLHEWSQLTYLAERGGIPVYRVLIGKWEPTAVQS